jgi:hypothetical protein
VFQKLLKEFLFEFLRNSRNQALLAALIYPKIRGFCEFFAKIVCGFAETPYVIK